MHLQYWVLLLSLCFGVVKSLELGENLIVNGRFSEPNIIAINKINRNYYAPSFIPGWTCSNTCQINNCVLSINHFLTLNKTFGNCKQQVIDVCSSKIQSVTQIFAAGQGEHNLEVEFLVPLYVANKKSLVVYFNSAVVYKYRPLVSFQYQPLRFATTVNPRVGSNNLTFTMEGVNDSLGYRLISVQLRKVINTKIEGAIQGVFKNSVSENTIRLPGLRVLFRQFLNVFVSLDRMQLYYFHNRNYSAYATIFLKGVSDFMESKGEISLTLQKKVLGEEGQKQQDFISQLQYKRQYINAFLLDKSENGFGFLANNSLLFVYSIPFLALSLCILYTIFRFTFNYKFSKFLRKYSFFGLTIIQMLFEGNVEQFTFYLCGELTTFFSVNFGHKFVNTFIAFFLFALCFYAVAAYFWCWKCYRRRIKYFTDNAQYGFEGILAYTVNSGVMCMVLGAVHQLLLPSPDLQIFVLMGVETAWIAMQLLMIGCRAYEFNLVVYLNVFEGMLRICFQISLFLFNKCTDDPFKASFLNNIILRQLLFFISIWIMQFIIAFAMCLKGLLNITKTNDPKPPSLKMKKKRKAFNCTMRIEKRLNGTTISLK